MYLLQESVRVISKGYERIKCKYGYAGYIV